MNTEWDPLRSPAETTTDRLARIHGEPYRRWRTFVDEKQHDDAEAFEAQFWGHQDSEAAFWDEIRHNVTWEAEQSLPETLRPYVTVDLDRFCSAYAEHVTLIPASHGGVWVFYLERDRQ